jgi:cobaltochelatase CobT
MAEAVRLLTREALTSEPPPPAARASSICGGRGCRTRSPRISASSTRVIEDQDAYARATRRLIQDLDLDLGELDDSGRRPAEPGRRGRRREPDR